MTRAVVRRPISPQEAAALRRTIVASPCADDAAALLPQIDALRVVGQCECGCASVDFDERDPSVRARLVADAVGRLPGAEVQILVWAQGARLSALEIVEFGAATGGLPAPESIRSPSA